MYEYKCDNCGFLIEPTTTYFISDIQEDLKLHCPQCDAKYEVEHDCGDDGCYEYICPDS